MADFYSELSELNVLTTKLRLMAENQALYDQIKRVVSSNLDKLKNACRDVIQTRGVQKGENYWAFIMLKRTDGILMFEHANVVENVIHNLLGWQFTASISYNQDYKSNEIMYFLNVEW